MASQRVTTLQVLMNGLPVAHLRRFVRGELSFRYADSWLAAEDTRPVSLSLPLRHQEYSGRIVENYFDNLLPGQPVDTKHAAGTIRGRICP